MAVIIDFDRSTRNDEMGKRESWSTRERERGRERGERERRGRERECVCVFNPRQTL